MFLTHEIPQIAASGETVGSVDLTAFVGAKLNRQRNARGYMIPRTHGVTINVRGVQWIDADLRAVDASGLTICVMGGFAKHVPWAEVRHIVVEELGQ